MKDVKSASCIVRHVDGAVVATSDHDYCTPVDAIAESATDEDIRHEDIQSHSVICCCVRCRNIKQDAE